MSSLWSRCWLPYMELVIGQLCLSAPPQKLVSFSPYAAQLSVAHLTLYRSLQTAKHGIECGLMHVGHYEQHLMKL